MNESRTLRTNCGPSTRWFELKLAISGGPIMPSTLGSVDIQRVKNSAIDLPPHPSICSIYAFGADDQLCETGTGWVFGTQLVVTAAHVVLGRGFGNDRAAKRVEIRPGWHYPLGPLTEFDALRIVPHPSFVDSSSAANDSERDVDVDIAALILDQPLPGDCAPLASFDTGEDLEQGPAAIIIGYPATLPGGRPAPESREQYVAPAAVRDSSNSLIYYESATRKGFSGAPVMFTVSDIDYVGAINVGACTRNGIALKYGIRLSSGIVDWLQRVSSSAPTAVQPIT